LRVFVFLAALVIPAAAQSQTLTLTIQLAGPGNGTVAVVPGATLCSRPASTSCSVPIAAGTAVTLSANAPASGASPPGVFSAGTASAAACGKSTCSFTMTTDSTVRATFDPAAGPLVTISATLAGNGQGEVGIDKSSRQNYDPAISGGTSSKYVSGSVVSIGASPVPESRFSGFSGGTNGAAGCGAAALCSFTANADASVTATFHALTALAVAPATASVFVGGDQQFSATGTYSNGVTEPIAVGVGAWRTKAPLTTGRSRPGAAAVNGRIYVIGGGGSTAPGATVESYDPVTNTWSPAASMVSSREGPGVAVANNLMYAIGGNSPGSIPLAGVERYDPATNTWIARAPLPVARRFLAAATLNGIVYALGGETASGAVASVDAYDPATSTWSPRAPMSIARTYLAAATLGGILYALGGDPGTVTAGTVEAYDPVTDKWTPRAAMPGNRGPVAAAVVDGVLYAFAGDNAGGSVTAAAYDPVRDQWGLKKNVTTARAESAAAALNGVVYVIGGRPPTGAPFKTVEALTDVVRWSSSNTSVAPVDQSGRALAVTTGQTDIVATIGGTFTCATGGACGKVTVSPCSYTLDRTSGSATGAGGLLSVSVTTGAPCVWTASTASTFVTIASGQIWTGNGTVSISIAGNTSIEPRSASVTIAGITVSITQSGLPTMSLDRTALFFAATTNGTRFTSQTSSQPVRLIQTGVGIVNWTASSNAPWLVVSPASGSGSTILNVRTQFVSGLMSSQLGSIHLMLTGPAGAGPINVTLTTTPSGASTAPTGAFDTPVDGSTGVTGSIPVTGWAMDDVEVTRVRIMRDPVAGEPSGTLVFIGDAVLVDGARPDVQASFPDTPRNTRAGWGYLLLTTFLPNLGNGTFKLYAIAEDADGHATTLGTRTITCANSTATAPFGAIDTPGQGETISGSNYANFGWVLSPGTRRSDPPSGGTVRVVIDGVIGAAPGGWVSRGDLTSLFPVTGFSGVGSALGVLALDTTTLANGVHTISWLVTDNQRAASGVGSRYFTVSNGSGLTLDPGSFRLPSTELRPEKAEATEGDNSWLPPSAFAEASADRRSLGGGWSGGSIVGRRGFDLSAPYQTYRAGPDGVITIRSEELDRVELQLEGIEGLARRVEGTLTGYLRVAGGLAPLPIGSHLDTSTGTFTWQPGVGFVGAYDFVLGGRDVRIVLNAKGSGRVGPQTVIDLPLPPEGGRSSTSAMDPVASGYSRKDAIVLAGWAADLDSPIDAGVDTVHVWAYPVDGGDPTFLGAAEYGGPRPDVAAIYGERFRHTGYGMRAEGLAPGTYDLAVFAYSTVKGGFVPAKTARVTVR
jgi:hypothetical protein